MDKLAGWEEVYHEQEQEEPLGQTGESRNRRLDLRVESWLAGLLNWRLS